MIQNNLFHTQPLILHASVYGIKGRVLEFWEKIRNLATRNPKTHLRIPNVTVITWNNLQKGCFESSCERQGVQYTVLGKEVKQWSHYYKLQYTVDLINSLETEYIICCDSHDALLLSQPENILDKFLQKFDCDILFGGECKFYPDLKNPVTNKWKKFQSNIAKSKFCYLSAGAYIGRKEVVKEFLTNCNKIHPCELFDCSPYKWYPGGKEIGCDQSTMQCTFPSFYPRIQIDYKCEIFQNLAYNHPNDVGFLPIRL